MQKAFRGVIAAFVLCWVVVGSVPFLSEAADARPVLRVGVYDNPPHSLWKDGKPEGFFVSVWELIARKEGIAYEYQSCSLQNCLEKLRAGQLDATLVVAGTPARREYLDFPSTPVFNNWGTVFVRKQLPVESLLDLKGKKIAIDPGDAHGTAFQELMRNFGFAVEIVPAGSFTEVFTFIHEGKVDAGVVARTFGEREEHRFDIKRTSVIFNPIGVSIAFSKGRHMNVATAIDRELPPLVADQNSEYHALLDKWMGVARTRQFPSWIYLALGLMVSGLVTVGGSAYVFRRQVQLKTAEVRKQEERFRAIFDASSDAIFTLKDGVLTDCNAHTPALFGYPDKEKLLGRSPVDFSPEMQPDGKSSLVSAQEKIAAACSGESLHFEWQHKRSDGELIDADVVLSPLDLAGGRQLVAVVRNITDRKISERKIQETTSLLRAIVDNAPTPILMLDGDYRVQMWNPAAERVYGWSAEELMGKKLPYLDGDEREKVRDALDHACAEGTPVVYESHRKTKEGRDLIVLAASAPVLGTDGIVGVHVDITEQKRIQGQLLQAQKMDAVGRLAGGVAHDFNNLLTAIVGYATFITDLAETAEKKDDYARSIIDVANRAAALTKSLLVFSRKHEAEFARVNIHDVINDFLKLIGRIIGEDVKVTTRMEGTSLPVTGNAGQLGQLLLNLATNARDAMPDGGTISISARQVVIDESFVAAHGMGVPGWYVLLVVSDTGTGIAREHLKQIFEPFFTTKEAGKGTGLGLAIVFGIVQTHHGFIDVYSEVGVGTTFKIYLPVQEADVIRENEIQTGPAPGGKETILVAEDDELIRQILIQSLTNAGYQVVACRNGAEAFELYQKYRREISLILSDVVMPKMNGKALHDSVKADRPDMKMIFLSGYTSDILEDRIQLETNVDVMYKPVSPVQLLQKIRTVLDS